MSRTYRLAVIGCGSIAEIAHFPSIKRTPQAELTAAGFHDVKITRLDHTWDVPTPEAYYDSIDGTSPVFAPMWTW